MNLPIIDPFSPRFEDWETRFPTAEEIAQTKDFFHRPKVKMNASVSNAHEAAIYAARGANNALGNFIDNFLNKSTEFKQWRQAMPSATPKGIAQYQRSYPRYDSDEVSAEINAIGRTLSNGQCLFHAGIWPGGSQLNTNRPLSTTMCPRVALSNANQVGKAYDAGRIDLWVLRAVNPATNVFVFKRKGTQLGHESEVLFAAGATLRLTSSQQIGTSVAGSDFSIKEVPVHVLTIDIS